MSYAADRRNLLKFPAASPLLATNALAEGLRWPDPMEWVSNDAGKLISDPTQALNVFDFERRRTCRPRISAIWRPVSKMK
jgi:hypothetical protein